MSGVKLFLRYFQFSNVSGFHRDTESRRLAQMTYLFKPSGFPQPPSSLGKITARINFPAQIIHRHKSISGRRPATSYPPDIKLAAKKSRWRRRRQRNFFGRPEKRKNFNLSPSSAGEKPADELKYAAFCRRRPVLMGTVPADIN